MADVRRLIPYSVQPILPFGAEIFDLQLRGLTDVDDELVHQIRADVVKHKLLVFRDQGRLTEEELVSLTRCFGEIETAGFTQHPSSTQPEVLCVSNCESQGFLGVGDSGFHVDTSFLKTPSQISIYHIIEAPKEGSTLFVSLPDVYLSVSDEQRAEWEELWLVKTYKNIARLTDHPSVTVHPLVYTHPYSKHKTMMVHQGRTSRFMSGKDSLQQTMLTKEATADVVQDIEAAIYRDNGSHIYHHKWRAGDLLLSDNLALAHLASPETQLSPDQVGQRVLHRTLVRGTHRPTK